MAALELRSRTNATERTADSPENAPAKKQFFPSLPHRAARPLRKVLYFVHLWVGLLLGAYFVVLGITGSILVFRDEIDQAMQPALCRVVVPAGGAATRLPLQKAADAVTQKFPNTRVSALVLPTAPNRPLVVQYGAIPPAPAAGSPEAQAQAGGPGNNGGPNNGGRGAQDRGGAAPPRRQQAFVNPYTGDILGQRGIGGSFIGTVHSLHENLLLANTGRQINGYGSLFLFALVVSGIWLWWPSVRDWSRQFKQRTRMKKGAPFKRQMHDLHNVVGFYSCLALVLIVITGASQIWRDQARAIIFAMTGTVAAAEGQSEGGRGGRGGGGRGGFGGGQNGQQTNGANNTPAANEPPALTLDQVAAVAGRVVPDTSVRALQMPRRAGGNLRVTLSIGSDAPGIRARQVTVEVNQRTGRIGDIVDPRRMPLGIVLNSWLTSIHYGQWGLGGTYYFAKVIHCLVGLTPLLLFGTGLVMWWEKRKGKMANQKKRKQQAQPTAA